MVSSIITGIIVTINTVNQPPSDRCRWRHHEHIENSNSMKKSSKWHWGDISRTHTRALITLGLQQLFLAVFEHLNCFVQFFRLIYWENFPLRKWHWTNWASRMSIWPENVYWFGEWCPRPTRHTQFAVASLKLTVKRHHWRSHDVLRDCNQKTNIKNSNLVSLFSSTAWTSMFQLKMAKLPAINASWPLWTPSNMRSIRTQSQWWVSIA